MKRLHVVLLLLTTVIAISCKGPEGPSGLQGGRGLTGQEGPAGPAGTALDEVQLIALIEGVISEREDGLRGPEGPTGPQGIQGVSGLQGPTGPQGKTGPQGLTGEKGDFGPMGLKGSHGLQGPKGDRGPAGERGLIGATGLRGPQGLQGPSGLTGPQGPTGSLGPAGNEYWAELIVLGEAMFSQATDGGLVVSYSLQSRVEQGRQIWIYGAGFQNAEAVNLFLDGELLASVVADTAGVFELSRLVPLTTRASFLHSVNALGSGGSRAAYPIYVTSQDSEL